MPKLIDCTFRWFAFGSMCTYVLFTGMFRFSLDMDFLHLNFVCTLLNQMFPVTLLELEKRNFNPVYNPHIAEPLRCAQIVGAEPTAGADVT